MAPNQCCMQFYFYQRKSFYGFAFLTHNQKTKSLVVSQSTILKRTPTKKLHATLRLYDVGEFIERQTNQQQKAKLEKQMYNTLTVRPNIVKPTVMRRFNTVQCEKL